MQECADGSMHPHTTESSSSRGATIGNGPSPRTERPSPFVQPRNPAMHQNVSFLYREFQRQRGCCHNCG